MRNKFQAQTESINSSSTPIKWCNSKNTWKDVQKIISNFGD